ncbi:MAG: LysR family transcriptional regulator [Rhodobacteraceae bacterium]|jgi:DNA-binding transcriptional LysR family regulator|nr:LysR family transcriptional regulator [Paracoccaceae bacterium]
MEQDKLANVNRRLLLTLKTLLDEKSITRTARVLGQSPPAISLALRHLRELLGDQLLIRDGARMVLTERAQGLIKPTSEAIASLDQIFAKNAPFDPKCISVTFNIASTTSMTTILLAPFAARMAEEAPNANLLIRSIEPEFDYESALANGDLDLVISDWPYPPPGMRMLPLVEDQLACLMRADHPLAVRDRISLETYLEQNHISPIPTSLHYLGPIGGRLAETGHRRRIAVSVPEFNLIPFILLQTELIFTSARSFCEHWARILPLSIVDAPDIFAPARFYILWHDRSHASPQNRWLRARLHTVAQEAVRTAR